MAAIVPSSTGGRMNVGVVGVGIAGASHLFDLASSDQYAIAAVCARRRNRAIEAAERYGAQAAFDDPADMIAQARLDAVVIATPPETSPAVARVALDSGLPTLIDKPAAPTASALAQVAADADASSGKAVVAYNRRYQQHVHEARDLLAPSVRATVTGVECEWGGPFAHRFTSSDTYRPHAGWGHGVVLDTASHILDTLQFLGIVPLVVEHARLTRGQTGADVAASIDLRWLPNGVPVSIRIHDGPGEDRWAIVANTTEGTLALTREGMVSNLSGHPVAVGAVDIHRPVDDLSELVNGRKPLGATLTEAIAVLATIDQIRAVATRRRPWQRPRAKALGRLNGAC